MNESLFQSIWQFSLYRPQQLFTTDGEAVTIINPGKRNTNAGPDFFEAKVRIGNVILVGNIELHIHPGEWTRHSHHKNPAYQNIILHVVYYNSTIAAIPENVPMLVMEPHIPSYIIKQYTELVQTNLTLPCANALQNVNELVREAWINRLLAERWEQKLLEWKQLLTKSAGDWRTLLYWRIAANFGFKINADPFLMLAQYTPINVLAKHRENLMQTEAILFGQAGFLESETSDDYFEMLRKEYCYLRQKYQLQAMPNHLWKFLRLRPANFPTVRIAQFAALIHRSVHLFSQIVAATDIPLLHELFSVQASEYWDHHYRFGEHHEKKKIKHLGTSSVENLIINTIAPIQFLYASEQGQEELKENALQLLESITPEKNHLTELWQQHGWQIKNAMHSQALLQLYNGYCSSKRCLECSIGLNIIRSRPDK
ncbi:DUF2851 family protein [Taibaiella soli]|uniref:DUF2851 domain-containing protein n=1 Tax=Taibaiella soli TaxID=1649169 RepID=A0A2W2AP22_9BACT|nr:DUF2851 family protein [Taibaiella soli]PZF74120.1 DUF2851 domain-containing protein [Taibaiella soli]